jgi:hypothetical protein
LKTINLENIFNKTEKKINDYQNIFTKNIDKLVDKKDQILNPEIKS